MLYETENPHGGDVYAQDIRLDFSSNVNPLGPPERVIAAIQDAALLVRQYPDPYCRKLTAAISAHEALPKAYILCGNGAAELIYAYCEALRPKKAMELAPTFLEYSAAAQHFGARIVRVPLSPPDFSPDERVLDALRTEKPDVLFLCSPNNPTGRTLRRALLEKILDAASELGTRVFLDECFLDFTDGKSAKELLSRYENLLILKAFTKNYALAGVRVGYCLSAGRALLSDMAACTQPWNVSILAQAAGAASLMEPDWVDKAKAVIAPERLRLTKALQIFGFSVCPSEANYLLFSAPVGLDRALLREKIAVRNCENYPGLGPGWYRVAVRLAEENEALLEAMRRVMEDTTWH